VSWLALDPDGGRRASGQRDLDLPLASTGRAAFTLALGDVLDLPAGRTILRVMVSSQLLDKTGTVHVPVDVPALTGSTLEVTPLVLGAEARPDVRVANLGASATIEPFPPTTRRTFTAADRVRVFARVFTPQPARVAAEVRLTRDGQTISSEPVHLVLDRSQNNAEDCNAVLAFSGLPPGAYAIELVARLPTGRAVTRAAGVSLR
jgi:hypothetical protein